jgi:hypothetical protein
LFLGGDSWQVPGAPGQGGPGQGGPQPGNRYGYQRAQRRRRWMMGGLAVGTAAAVAIIAVIVASLGNSSSSNDANQAATTPPAPTTQAPTTSPSASPSTSATTGGSLLSDGQSGLAYTQLPAPWQPTCPSDLNNGAFTWTAGESAIAGQVNGGQQTWYGEACSGPLPQQYAYTGVQDLQTVAANLATTFQNAYYTALQHTVTPEVSQPVSVSGHAGWEVTYQVSYSDATAQGATWTDEQAAVIVADTGGRQHARGVLHVGPRVAEREQRVDACVFAPAERGAERRQRLPGGQRAVDQRALGLRVARGRRRRREQPLAAADPRLASAGVPVGSVSGCPGCGQATHLAV